MITWLSFNITNLLPKNVCHRVELRH